ncbi:hypothetical protein ACFUJU_28785 [Streptomyces sp. NPDC057235]|uniref:VG15 protein n=1 Tax=Streptomyces sp. NPDC057235 TaxID=3346058 RepID=UPI0036305EAA
MSPSPEAVAHAEARRRLADATSRAAMQAWRQVDRDNIRLSWIALLSRVLAIVGGGQLAAARSTEVWLEQLLGEDPDRASEQLNPAALVGVDGAGRAMTDVLMAPMWAALRMVTEGKPVAQSMVHGQGLLDAVVRTAVADAGRAADQVGMASRPAITSYVRVVESGACSRCIVLAGREYGVSKAFARHPRCHCGMEPVTREHRPEPVDAKDLFDKMTAAEKKKTFGQDGAKAIEAGADIAQVVNARRGMATAVAYGKTLQITTEGTTRRGLAGQRRKKFEKVPGMRYRVSKSPRLMPEEIFRIADDDRGHAIQLLRRNGYLY